MRTYGIFARSSDSSEAPVLITTSRSFHFAFNLARQIQHRSLSTLAGNRDLSESCRLSDIMDVYSFQIGTADSLPEVSLFEGLEADRREFPTPPP